MRKYQLPISFIALFCLITSCSRVYQPSSVEFKDYRIKNAAPGSSAVSKLLQPYADSVNKSMNDVIAVAGMPLEKRQPECTLGNLMADAMLAMSKEKYQTHVDAAFVNYGGIRLTSMAEGNITRGKIFELSPFDNIVVLLKVNGSLLQEFMDHIASRGGWPCAGITYQVKDKKAIHILIGGAPLKAEHTYTLAVVDYVANGGDDCTMLQPIPQQNNGYLFRDALIAYLSRQHSEGKQINVLLENRVSYAK
ncbi:MAG TPA: 5'-nucleotidase [Ferruginibacter sp.]|nr:5'-nucleotidase [Ferruginibacter sp.]HMP20842.1 5'-nucleotidase [Ferruginibacter sp.]